jgi:hypothetical protein
MLSPLAHQEAAPYTDAKNNMNLNTITYITYWVIGALLLAAVVIGAWFYLFVTPPATNSATAPGSGFGIGDDRSVTVLPGAASTEGENTTVSAAGASQNSQKIFKVADGPVTTATLIQTFHPTTTIARYVLQENGHVLDLVLDNSGIVPRAISNTTIPGTVRGLWAAGGSSVIMQYLDNSTVKTVYLGFPATSSATSTRTQPVKIQFFPDNIIDVAISPDNKNAVYLINSSAGSDGYAAKIDGSSSKKLFSTPLSQVLVSWPSLNTMLLQTKSGVGITGAAFAVQAQTGTISSLVYAPGLTALADQAFSKVVYQTVNNTIASYVHDVKTGTDKALSFNPIPEKCAWSKVRSTILYCAAPVQYVPPTYLDLWHQGSASAADGIFAFDLSTGQSLLLAVPGSDDGGVAIDVSELAVSPDDHYLLFIKKGDRSLWALRLIQ